MDAPPLARQGEPKKPCRKRRTRNPKRPLRAIVAVKKEMATNARMVKM
jgi:hypothetical protein